MKRKLLRYGGAAMLALGIAGCGSDGQDGQNADPAVLNSLQSQVTALSQAANPEQCVLCHTGSDPVARSGSMHQTSYNELYQDKVVEVVTGSMGIAVTTTTAADDTTLLTFQLTKKDASGTPQKFDCTKLNTSESGTSDFTIGSYWAQYDVATKRFPDDLSLAPTTAAQVAYWLATHTSGTPPTQNGERTYDSGTGVCTMKKTYTSSADLARLQLIKAGTDAIVQLYGVDEILTTNAALHMSNGKYPFAGVLKIGATDYSSLANVSGCENCHTQPFLKHAYIYGKVTDNAGNPTEFYTCKGCHYDTRTGGHLDWQILKDDPAREAAIRGGSAITAAEKTKYAYKARLMNDVHMSHNMEFAYPQEMFNCVTCHEGKLSSVLATSNFTAETCISCHSLTDPDNETSGAARGAGLVTMMSAFTVHNTYLADTTYATLRATNCQVCHDGSVGPTFTTLHKGGYDPKIYATDGTRYSTTFLASVDSASISGNTLSITFSATTLDGTGTLTVGTSTMLADSIVPTVIIGLYGYNTKDFIVAAHGTDANGKRNLEYVWDGTASNNPTARFTQVSKATAAGVTTWQLTADLSNWASMISAGTVKRAEIAVLPSLKNADGVVVGLDAPSKTFNFSKNAFENYFSDIVQVAATTRTDGRKTGCNTCHDQLATTFHSGIRGGNIRVCRTCHEVSNAGSHLELQSRSIDSYVHAIHSFQAFDPGDINFNDPVAAMEYTDHTEMIFPRFDIQDCESCHKAGMYDVPNQAKSMPGVLSGTDSNATWTRSMGSYPPSVTGPAVRACGGCHRTHKINEDDAAGMVVLMQHWKSFGYVVEASTDSTERRTLWETIVAKIMALFS